MTLNIKTTNSPSLESLASLAKQFRIAISWTIEASDEMRKKRDVTGFDNNASNFWTTMYRMQSDHRKVRDKLNTEEERVDHQHICQLELVEYQAERLTSIFGDKVIQDLIPNSYKGSMEASLGFLKYKKPTLARLFAPK
jgi:trehalose/maltose hydrolase-like predicted phosphorylase